MNARALFLGLALAARVLGQVQEPLPAAPPTSLQEDLDGGLLEPGWFGPGPVWTRDWRVDFFWVRPGALLEPPTLYLKPWEEPRFLSKRDPLDYASGWAAAEYLQNLLRTHLTNMGVIRLATSPEQTPYHALGRIVEATHIRQGFGASFGIAAGLPTCTWDFKVVNVRTGEVLLASHHRTVMAPKFNWITALEQPLRQMAGLPPIPKWEVPPGIQEQEDGTWTWVAPGLLLPPGSLEAGTWTSETDARGPGKLLTSVPGGQMALGAERFLRARVARSKLARGTEEPPAYILSGQFFSSFKFLKPRYRAWVTETTTGRVVVRHEIRSPIKIGAGRILDEVAERIVSHLETLQKGAGKPSGVDAETGAVVTHLPPEQNPSGPGNIQPARPVTDSKATGDPPAKAATDHGVESPPPLGPGPDKIEAIPQPTHRGVYFTGFRDVTPQSPLADKGGTASAVQAPTPAWEGLDRLAQVEGPVDKVWVSPALSLAGRTLQVADWGEPMLQPEADSHDRRVASFISSQAPAWLYGALASHPDRGFRIHRQGGDVCLEGRVVHLYQPDTSKFWTGLGGVYTFGISQKAEGTLQLRMVDTRTGITLALVEQHLISFQVASDGIHYKAFKWLAQGLIEWLLKEGCRPVPPTPNPTEGSLSPLQGTATLPSSDRGPVKEPESPKR